MPVRNICLATLATALLFVAAPSISGEEVELDQRPAVAGEWGYRPADQTATPVNPPNFSWRPQKSIARWELECNGIGGQNATSYRTIMEGMQVHTPPRTFAPGEYQWRYRGITSDGQETNWSSMRRFTIAANTIEMPMPARDELLARIPRQHPRLFLRPEELPRLRSLAAGAMKAEFEELQQQCDRLLQSPPPTEEPPKYPAGMQSGSDPWRDIWWGNRTYTTHALNSAATLAFTRLLGGKEEYGQLAKRILLDCAKWDPKGATGYRYNDEAGMPYNYYFVRTYSFVNDLLTEEERDQCRQVMKIRGDEMYRHLYPNHLWRPYSSHSNRAWHFLGEVGIAMLGEVEGADDWVWFAMNVFYNTYPVWSDSDGGWHEGFSYWQSYMNRFTWWADVMRSAMGISAYDKPYFSQIGYYPMYLLPPGKVGGGFGDLNARSTSQSARTLMSQLAVQAGNAHWQWYVDQLGGARQEGGYIGFVRGALPVIAPQAPDDLPSSRCFQGVGQAVLNTNIEDANNDVQIVFKSSPFGTYSHGYESNNSFLLWAYGQRLLIRSGYRDSYGSDHHRNWMWTTRSTNNITVNGQGQQGHSQAATGEIIGFHTSPTVDYVVGEAGSAYRNSDDATSSLKQFTRTILLVKPDLIIVADRLVAREPSSFEYWLHATDQFGISDQHAVRVTAKDVDCQVDFLVPPDLALAQTNEYDPNPRPRITLREWHLTATTANQAQAADFVVALRPSQADRPNRWTIESQSTASQTQLVAKSAEAVVQITLPTAAAQVPADSHGVVERFATDGKLVETITIK